MSEDVYVTAYLNKIEELFLRYKKEINKEKLIQELDVVIDNYLQIGFKLPFDHEVYITSNNNVIQELFLDKGIPLSK